MIIPPMDQWQCCLQMFDASGRGEGGGRSVEFEMLADGNELLKVVVMDVGFTRIRHCI